MINHNRKKNKLEHNQEILREIQNRTMIEMWGIIPTSLSILHTFEFDPNIFDII